MYLNENGETVPEVRVHELCVFFAESVMLAVVFSCTLSVFVVNSMQRSVVFLYPDSTGGSAHAYGRVLPSDTLGNRGEPYSRSTLNTLKHRCCLLRTR